MSSGVALVNIDLQGRYTMDAAPFEIAHAGRIIDGINALAVRARAVGAPVIWITREVRPQVGPGRRTRRRYGSAVPETFMGEMARQDVRLHVADSDLTITKPRHSSFYASELDVDLRNLGCEAVVLTGFTTNVCVLATAQDAAARDYDVTVARDLTAALPIKIDGKERMSSDAVHAAALAFVEHAIGSVSESNEIAFEAAT